RSTWFHAPEPTHFSRHSGHLDGAGERTEVRHREREAADPVRTAAAELSGVLSAPELAARRLDAGARRDEAAPGAPRVHDGPDTRHRASDGAGRAAGFADRIKANPGGGSAPGAAVTTAHGPRPAGP